MTNQFTQFVFVYSRCSEDLDIYHNDIFRSNCIGQHTLLLYRGSILDFVYTDTYNDMSLPINTVTKLIKLLNGKESNVMIDMGTLIQAKIDLLRNGITNFMLPNIEISVYYFLPNN